MIYTHRILLLSFLFFVLVACSPTPTSVVTMPTPTALTPCAPEEIVIPTPLAEVPGYAELDTTTGLHVTGTPPEIDLTSYRLQITGKVDNPLSLSYDDLRCMPRIEQRCTINCPGFFQDEAVWAGASLDHLLDLAKVQEDVTALLLTGADGYTAIVLLSDPTLAESFLAYEWEGEPVPIIHGFPVRAVFPSLNGNVWVKWLVEIEVY